MDTSTVNNLKLEPCCNEAISEEQDLSNSDDMLSLEKIQNRIDTFQAYVADVKTDCLMDENTHQAEGFVNETTFIGDLRELTNYIDLMLSSHAWTYDPNHQQTHFKIPNDYIQSLDPLTKRIGHEKNVSSNAIVKNVMIIACIHEVVLQHKRQPSDSDVYRFHLQFPDGSVCGNLIAKASINSMNLNELNMLSTMNGVVQIDGYLTMQVNQEGVSLMVRHVNPLTDSQLGSLKIKQCLYHAFLMKGNVPFDSNDDQKWSRASLCSKYMK